MDINKINAKIKELEDSEESLSNIRNLSCLYIVRTNMSTDNITSDNVTEELKDVLPSYIQYVNMKRKYQKGDISKEKVISYLLQVCDEIEEFIHALYSGTDTPEERDVIGQLIMKIKRTF